MATVADSVSAPCANPKPPIRPKKLSKPPTIELRAERLILCDAQGRERFVLGCTPDGSARFEMFDGAGNALIEIVASQSGDMGRVAVTTPDGQAVAEIATFADDPENTAAIVSASFDEREFAKMSVSAECSPSVEVLAKDSSDTHCESTGDSMVDSQQPTRRPAWARVSAAKLSMLRMLKHETGVGEEVWKDLLVDHCVKYAHDLSESQADEIIGVLRHLRTVNARRTGKAVAQ